MSWILIAAGGLAWVAVAARLALVAARMFQHEEYDTRRLLTWVRETLRWLWHPAILIGVAMTGALGVAAAVVDARRLAAAGLVAGCGAAQLLWRWTPPKKPLVVTPRATRLLATAALLLTAIAFAAGLVMLSTWLWVAATMATLMVLLAPVVAVGVLIAANGLMHPVETSIRRGFLRRAERKIREIDPIVIAVAGSYGKTTTKRILAHLLAPHASTRATPKSFNTLMGITRTINDELSETDEIFVVEMDPYNRGEIAAMCRLTRPEIAVLCSVGPQHLERFGGMEAISDALYEAIDGLPPVGTAVVYAGEEWSRGLADRAAQTSRVVVRYGAAGEHERLDVTAGDIEVTGTGTSFTWRWPERGLEHKVHVPLLGRHQALNATAALAVVTLMDRPLQPSLEAIATLVPVEHRLQPLPTANGILVIDDAYNANPVGVHNGLEVLAALEASARILVTPGMVELGPLEGEENRRYGRHAAEVCDHVIVVKGRPSAALIQGVGEGKLPADRLHVVDTLDAATAVIGRIAKSGDAVLFANDLPDVYL